MTKPLPHGCIKEEKEISDLKKFNFILQNPSVDDKIDHIFVVDIIFDEKNADEKTTLFDEIYTPIFEKTILIKPYERSVLQIQSILAENHKGTLKTFKCN